MRAISLRTPVELCGSHSADRSSRTSLNFRISLVTRQLPGMWRIADSSRAPGSIRMNHVDHQRDGQGPEANNRACSKHGTVAGGRLCQALTASELR